MGTNQRTRRKFIRQGLIVTLMAAIVVSGLYYLDSVNNPTTDLLIWFESADGTSTPSYRVQIADSEGERSKGLMFRKKMSEDAGMLFIYRGQGQRNFWMKNTYIPLDMIFVNSDRKVVGIVENAEPLTTSLRGVDAPSQFIIELNAGRAKADKIQVGSLLKLKGEMPIAPE